MEAPSVGTDVLVRGTTDYQGRGRRGVVCDRIDRGSERFDWAFVRFCDSGGRVLFYEWIQAGDLAEV